ncbi:hypothetical protein KFL_007270050 [Klebsormidium nitens]|uniref:Uncharacterized protein n=1 Tax=Klebsormidium nitens TaxID=105231 RepID=A0A1Y1ISE8_KLENI|nr:hypothetical protein KFL_007270050 [Klebsormidium nitens]|eukprot:GAQ91098.1 hypothetical protein KFL_007270050 [Klebsormidium nitens]
MGGHKHSQIQQVGNVPAGFFVGTYPERVAASIVPENAVDQGQESWSLNRLVMARGRPHGRSKSDHRVCQAARHARAAEYRERIAISAEQQEARIAAVNAECDLQDAPQKRRSQKSSGRKKEAWTAGASAQRGSCKASGSGKKKASQYLGEALGKATERDLHSFHCHACGATAEFGLRGSKEGGIVKYSCRAHSTSNGCFRVDRDRADWAEDQELRRLRAEERRLEEELRKLGGTSFAAEPAAAWKGFQSKGVWASAPMSQSLIAMLLTIGGVERNPGPTSKEEKELALKTSWQEVDPEIDSDLLDHLAKQQLTLERWRGMTDDGRSKLLDRLERRYPGPGNWLLGWTAIFDKAAGVPSGHAKTSFKRSTCLDTSDIGVLAKGLVKKRRLELEQAGEAQKGLFEIGWSILPRAKPLGVKDLRFLVLKAEQKLGVAITKGLKRIYDRVKARGGDDVKEWIDQMKKMVYTDSFVEFSLTNWNDIDLRHVAVEGNKVRPAYPLVREAIAHFVEQVQGRAVFYSDQAVWAALSQELAGERVPAVAGLLTERCAIGAIIDGQGYKAVLKMEKSEQVKLVFFDRNAEASAVLTEQEDFRKSGLETRIACFVPRTPFYPAMDMAIVVFKKPKNQQGFVERLTKVQMTLESAHDHRRSTQTAMHIGNVKPWLGGAELESVDVDFCYIVPGALVKGRISRHTEPVEAKLGTTRGQAGSVQIVAHTHIELAFGQLDGKLGQVDRWQRGGK